MAEMKQRSLEEVKALSIEKAVGIMRQAGIMGAGGGGFPTYFKYKSPCRTCSSTPPRANPVTGGTSCYTKSISKSSSRFSTP